MAVKLKKWHKALIIIGCIILVWGTIAVWPRPQVMEVNPFIVEDGETPLIIAHRGGRREFPENTLEAFYNAVSVSENVMLETDVSITSDGIPVVCHDLKLDRTTNMTGLISDYTYEYLYENADFGYANVKEKDADGNETDNYVLTKYVSEHPDHNGQEVTPLDVDYPDGVTARHSTKFLVTKFEEVLQAFPNTFICVEIKQSGELGAQALQAVIDLIEDYNAFDTVIIGSFHNDIYSKIKELKKATYPDLMFSPETSGVVGILVTSWFLVDAFYNEPITCLQVPMSQYGIKVATRHFVNTAHAHNIAVQFWTINDEEDMRTLVELGVDGIMSDYPHRLASVYAEYQK